MSNIAAGLTKNVGGYNVTAADIEKYGGKWSEEFMAYVFPDGSTGGFTDIAHGAQERTRGGEVVLHFVPLLFRINDAGEAVNEK